jgi:hypothetical protein
MARKAPSLIGNSDFYTAPLEIPAGRLFRRRVFLFQWSVQFQSQNNRRTKQMTEESLRAVLVVDEKAKTFTPVAHNLSAEKAEAKVNELKSKAVQAQVLVQTSRHKGRGFKSCELCKNAAENLSQKASTGLVEEAEAESGGE